MYNLSLDFQGALRKSHTRIAKVEILKAGQMVKDLVVTGGNVTVDPDAAIRRRCSLEIVDKTLVPRSAADLLYPAGNEMKLYSGIRTTHPVTRMVQKRALVLYEGGSPRIPARLTALGWQVTSKPTAVAADLKYYDLVVADGSFFSAYSGGAVGLLDDAYELGLSVLTLGNDTTSVPPLATSSVGGTGIGAITPTVETDLHPIGYAVPATMSDPDDRTYLTGLRKSVVVLAAGTRAGDGLRLPMVIAEENPNGNQGRWVHWNTIAAPDALLDAAIGWVGQQRSASVSVDRYVPLGVFRISKPKISDDGEGVKITVDGYDRARRVSRSRLRSPRALGSGTNYAIAIRDLLRAVYPDIVTNFSIVTVNTGNLYFDRGADAWEEALKMAEAIGHQLYFDVDGICVLKPEPDPNKDPIVWDYSEGEVSMLLAAERDLDDERAYNHVIVEGQTDNGTPIVAEAFDSDPLSPTFTGVRSLISQGKTVTSSHAIGGGDAPLSAFTDGLTNGGAGAYITILNPAGAETPLEAWLQVDLGSVQTIEEVRVWHYHLDGRMFDRPRTEVSEDGVNWTVVSAPANYYETSAGHLRRFSPTRARYVRDYMSGNFLTSSGAASTGRGYNHWVEIQVFSALGQTSYGSVPYFYKSEFIATQAQAQAVADATLLRVSGVLEEAAFTSIVNPAHEAGDVIRVGRDTVGVEGVYVLTGFTIPLGYEGSMTAGTRKRRAN